MISNFIIWKCQVVCKKIILSESYNVDHIAIVVMQTIRRILIAVIYVMIVNIFEIYKFLKNLIMVDKINII